MATASRAGRSSGAVPVDVLIAQPPSALGPRPGGTGARRCFSGGMCRRARVLSTEPRPREPHAPERCSLADDTSGFSAAAMTAAKNSCRGASIWIRRRPGPARSRTGSARPGCAAGACRACSARGSAPCGATAPSRSAICLYDSPLATSRSTSVSRSVSRGASRSSAPAGDAASRRYSPSTSPASPGVNTASPAAVRRTASRNSCGAGRLQQVAGRAGLDRVEHVSAARRWPRASAPGRPGRRRRRPWITSTPEMSGSCRSSTTTSGRAARGDPDRLPPLAAGRDHVVAGLGQVAGHALAPHRVVVDHHHADGHAAAFMSTA